MSEPKNENKIDKLPKNTENQSDKLNVEPELNKKESRLPVGKLKWSKEEELKRSQQSTESAEAAQVLDEEKKGSQNEEQTDGNKNSIMNHSKEQDIPQKAELELQEQEIENQESEKIVATAEKKTKSTEQTNEIAPEKEQLEDTDVKPEGELDKEKQELVEKPVALKSRPQKPSPPQPEKPKKPVVAKKAIGKPETQGKQGTRFAKILWLPSLLFVVLIIGLMIGHSYIGGQPATDVFDISMWEHVYKLIFG
jgi:DNA-directed RNA polymerase subunit beta